MYDTRMEQQIMNQVVANERRHKDPKASARKLYTYTRRPKERARARACTKFQRSTEIPKTTETIQEAKRKSRSLKTIQVVQKHRKDAVWAAQWTHLGLEGFPWLLRPARWAEPISQPREANWNTTQLSVSADTQCEFTHTDVSEIRSDSQRVFIHTHQEAPGQQGMRHVM